MAADGAPGPADPAPADRRAASGVSEVGEEQERCGPLAIARYLKDDGRALLLYRHADADLD
jgi:hypothetical protein